MSYSKKSKFFKLGPLQREWVDALKSGKHRQTQKKLTVITSSKHKKHCCLGLLCHLNRNDLLVSNDGSTVYYKFKEFNPITNLTSLPKNIEDKLNFFCNLGDFTTSNLTSKEYGEFLDYVETFYSGEDTRSRSVIKLTAISLAALNDLFGFTFKKIAHVIETYPQMIFSGPI